VFWVLIAGRAVNIMLVSWIAFACFELCYITEAFLGEMGLKVPTAVIIGYITLGKGYIGPT
jgi:hypothetical protein